MQLTAYGEMPGRTSGPLPSRPGNAQSSIWLGMKLTAMLLLVAFLQVSAKGISQGITLNVKRASLEKVMAEIERQSGYHFLYTKAELDKSKSIDVSVSNVDLITALTACFQEQPFQYSVVGNNIVLQLPPPPAAAPSVVSTFFHLFTADSPPGKFKGKVVNDEGKPLEDAAVMIKGTKKHAYADKNGVFELDGVAVGTTLVISYPGFTPVEYQVKSLERTAALDKLLPAGINLYVVLQPSKSGLDEMQVIAYGKVSKRFNAGNVTTINAEDIAKNPVVNVLEALQGRVPGMLVQQATGTPGGNFTVQIRGQSSFNLNSPLFVIDGVVYPANQALPLINPALYGYDRTNLQLNALNGGNALNYFDPSLIESVSILKDADATAIYGSRGAYGVILITTKKGKPGQPRLTVGGYSGVTQRGVSPKLMNTQEYLALRKQAFKNDNAAPTALDWDVNGTWDSTKYTNWDKYFVGNGTTSSVNANYSGGVGTTSYLIGGNFTRLGSITRGGGAQNSGGLNFNINTGSLNQKFTATFNGNFSTTVNDMLPVDYIGIGASIAPNFPGFTLPNGQPDWRYIGTGQFSAASKKNMIYHGVTNNLVGNTQLKYTPIRGLNIFATLGYNLLTARELVAYPSTYVNPTVYNPPGSIAQSTISNISNSTVNFDPYANYTTRLFNKGRLDVTVGMDMQSTQATSSAILGKNYVTDATIKDPTAGITVSSSYSTTPNRQLGYFGRVYYIWDQKYILDLTGRYDGSTKFGPGKQFGAFGAIGAGWIFSEERWLKHNLHWLSFGKLRGSFGTTGGDGVPNYAYLTTYGVTNNNYQGGLRIAPNGLANPYLQWETNKKKELGLELRFLKDRITVEANYYDQRTSNQLVSIPLSVVTGYQQISQNSPAIIKNTGFEAALTTVNVQSKSFTWRTSFNITFNRNKLVAYPGAIPGGGIRNNANLEIGRSMQNIKIYNYTGVDPKTGLYFFTNAKGVADSYLPFFTAGLQQTDRTVNLDMQTKYFGGLQNSINYKGFSLDFFFYFTRRPGFNYLGQQLTIPGVIGSVPTEDWAKSWKNPGDVTAFPKVTQNALNSLVQQLNFRSSTGAYETITYARLQNLALTYNFQPVFLKKAKITALSVFIKGQNLLTISKYKQLDPENMAAGAMGPYRIYTGGVNITL
ncbi:MAG: SusC/RagA family TonB-linked outer membrane protein [Bacteroidetes bacterium]|nr:SusC/RagA family TonB-linked outer membrane protein [Bacteroidota bacterium]